MWRPLPGGGAPTPAGISGLKQMNEGVIFSGWPGGALSSPIDTWALGGAEEGLRSQNEIIRIESRLPS